MRTGAANLTWTAALVVVLSMACAPGAGEAVPEEPSASVPGGDLPAGAVDTDPGSGLLIDENWQLVKANCSACHSPRLVTQNRGSRQTWLEMIRWMQESQGLWKLDAETEKGILDYLEKNYAPDSVQRRAPLPLSQMPDNPHAGKADAGEAEQTLD